MIYALFVALLLAVGYLGMRLFLIKRAIRETSEQLREINSALQENRQVKLSVPDEDLEELLMNVNHSLQTIRAEKVSFRKRELEFKQQMEGISHDLRTPLTSMLGYLRIMDMSGLGEEEKQDLQIVLRKAERLQELITEVYDFSRLSAGEYGLNMEMLDVTRCLRNALADGYGDLEQRGLDVRVKIPEVSLTIRADEGALKRVFQNFLQNAERYAVSMLTVSVEEMEGEVVLSFQNDVEDLSIRDVEKIFQRFYTRDKARGSGSTGLGLSIAKEFVEQMQGSIEADMADNVLCIRIRFRKMGD